ncbi:MAG: EAL domain-containing protein [Caldilineaceae bacterium]
MRLSSVSLRIIWLVPFIALILLTVGLVGFLSMRNGQLAANQLANQLIDRSNQLVIQHLESYLSIPQRLVQLDAKELESGLLVDQDYASIGHYFWQQVKLYPLSFINYGLESGEYAGAGHDGDSMYEGELSPTTEMQYYDFQLDEQGQRISQKADPEYDFKEEAWYADTMRAGKPIWSRIYLWDGTNIVSNTMSIAFSYPIFHGQQQPVGAIGIDLSLARISDFLNTLRISPSAKLLIVEHDGMVVATSSKDAPVIWKNEQVERLNLKDIEDPLIQAATSYLTDQAGGMGQITASTPFQFSMQGERQFLHVTPWRDQFGLNWWILVIVPEADFMGGITSATRLTILLCIASFVAAILIGLFTWHQIRQPINKLKAAAQRIAAGQLEERVPPSAVQELHEVGLEFNRMTNQLLDSFSKLEFLASHDPLTGLANRATFRDLITERLRHKKSQAHSSSAAKSSSLFAVLFLDLDYFKLLNDSFGHLAGDQVLIEIAQRLKGCAGEHAHVARFGGDEFVILLKDIAQPHDAERVAEKILGEIRKPFVVNQNSAFISSSIGIVFDTGIHEEADDMLRDADIALYRAKSLGKATYVVFDREMHVEVLERLTLESDLRKALDQNTLSIYYQPIVDINSLDYIGVEALLRWQHPRLGMVMPDKFIPIAEETGLIIPIGWWVMRRACEQMRQWQQQFPGSLMEVSVNLSARQFLHPNLLSEIEETLRLTQLAPQSLKLEITESLLISDRVTLEHRLAKLKELGVKISLDDFGTGYSSLSYLHRFPLDTLKIDRSFVQQMMNDQHCGAVVESIVSMAHKLGMEVVAEGVETQEALEYLRTVARCEQIQGFLIAPALPVQQITNHLQRQSLTHSLLLSHTVFAEKTR